jgi:hypothetical protein
VQNPSGLNAGKNAHGDGEGSTACPQRKSNGQSARCRTETSSGLRQIIDLY